MEICLHARAALNAASLRTATPHPCACVINANLPPYNKYKTHFAVLLQKPEFFAQSDVSFGERVWENTFFLLKRVLPVKLRFLV
jgi:hypothetical protein